jgi:osmotically-inducible protein OsmY
MSLTATVLDGKVMLTGTVKSDEQKARAEKLVRGVKGVRAVDNQVIVSSSSF